MPSGAAAPARPRRLANRPGAARESATVARDVLGNGQEASGEGVAELIGAVPTRRRCATKCLSLLEVAASGIDKKDISVMMEGGSVDGA